MPQVFLEPGGRSGDVFEIRGAEAHHLIRVVRAKAGDAVFLFDGDGNRFRGIVSAIDPAGPLARGRITAQLPEAPRPYRLRLLQGLPRGQKFDYVLEKAVELGVDEIVPFLGQKSPLRLTEESAPAKVDRWRRIVEAACKQSNRATLPTVAVPRPLKEQVDALEPGVAIVLDERGAPLHEAMAGVRNGRSISGGDSAMITLVVGPESGFSPSELEMLAGRNARFASLGARTLRTETAGLAALAVVDYELNQKTS